VLDTNDLELLLAIADLGAMRLASNRVHLSQPAMSRRLQALERRIGAPLFQRTGRRMLLTEAGEAFAHRARDILARMADLELEMNAFGRGQRGALRIGATVTVCLYLLPPILAAMRTQYPQYELFLTNDRSGHMSELVRNGAIDVGIASVGAPLTGLQVQPWLDLQLGLLQQSSPETAQVSIHSLDHKPLVMNSPGSLRSAVERALQVHNVHPRAVAQADSLEVVLTLVACGFGAAVVPLEVLRPDAARNDLTLTPFIEELPPLQVALFHRRMSAPLGALLRVIGLENQ
jgi:LysR family cyn operon transcriptional activator